MKEIDFLVVLRRARSLIYRGWCQNSYARSYARDIVDVTSPQATHFCAAGAIARVSLPSESGAVKGRAWNGDINRLPAEAQKAISRLDKLVPRCTMIAFNDHSKTTRRDVLDLFDRAIDQAEGWE